MAEWVVAFFTSEIPTHSRRSSVTEKVPQEGQEAAKMQEATQRMEEAADRAEDAADRAEEARGVAQKEAGQAADAAAAAEDAAAKVPGVMGGVANDPPAPRQAFADIYTAGSDAVKAALTDLRAAKQQAADAQLRADSMANAAQAAATDAAAAQSRVGEANAAVVETMQRQITVLQGYPGVSS